MKRKIGAIFDIDGTILRPASGILYVQHLWKQGRISPLDIMRITYWQVLHNLGLIEMEKVASTATAPFSGTLEEDMAVDCHKWFHRDVKPRLLPKAMRRMRWHLKKGHEVVILTGASPYLVRPLSDHIGKGTPFRATTLEVHDGKFTGKVSRVVYDNVKVEAALELAHEHDFDLHHSYAYADSISDRALLESVGRPVAVNPDPRLLYVAWKNGWKRVRW